MIFKFSDWKKKLQVVWRNDLTFIGQGNLNVFPTHLWIFYKKQIMWGKIVQNKKLNETQCHLI